MSMRNYANHGHCVKASELATLLPKECLQEFELLLQDGDWESLQNLVNEKLDKSYPTPEIFRMDEEYESDDLEIGEFYAVWCDDDLFVKTETDGMKALKHALINPKDSQWVTWG